MGPLYTAAPVAEYDRYRRALAGLRLPCAFVDLDRFDANAAALEARAGGLPIRVASKSLRCLALIRRVLERPGFAGVMAYSADEAAWLHERGVDDILVAYPSLERADLERVCARVAAGATIRLCVDDRAQVAVLDAIATVADVTLELVIDVDMSTEFPGLHFGVRRSPLRGVDEVLELAELISLCEGLRLVGLLAFEAQIAGQPDALPEARAKSRILRELKRRSIGEFQGRRRAIVEALREAFGPEVVGLVNGGGTGSLESSRRDPALTELSAGSGLFAPGRFDHYRDFVHHPAAGFALPAVRRPSPTILTCAGGGLVASGPPGWGRLPTPWQPPGGRLLAFEGAGEVQTPVEFDEPPPVDLGDPILFRHAKAGELCEHFPTLALIHDGAVVDEVETYRGAGRVW